MPEVDTYEVYRQSDEADCSEEFVGSLDLHIDKEGDCIHRPLEIDGVHYIPQL